MSKDAGRLSKETQCKNQTEILELKTNNNQKRKETGGLGSRMEGREKGPWTGRSNNSDYSH